MNAKRTLSLCLLAALLLQAAACGESSGAADDTTVPSSPDDTTTAAQVSEYTVPNVDYGGKTITMTGYDYDELWAILDYHVALEEENGDVINDAIVRRNRMVEEELNVSIELIPLGKNDRNSAAILEKYILAQEDTVQVGMQMTGGMSNLLATEGMLVDLNDITTLDLSNSWWNQAANEEFTIYGKQLTAVGDMSFFNLGAPVVFFFSKNMVEENKLDNPYQLVYDGKWTFDTMEKMATQVARDINGNGQVDNEDIFGFGSERAAINTFYFASGIRYSNRDSSGEIQLAINTEKTVDVTTKAVQLLRDKNTTIYSQDWMTEYPTNVFAEFMMPKRAKGELLFFANQLHVALSLRNAEYDFGVLPPPKYDEEQENYITFGNTAFCDQIVVPSTNTDLDMIGYFLEAMGYYAKQYITPAFIDVSVKGKVTRDEDSAKMIDLVYNSQIFDVGLTFNWGSLNSSLQAIVTNNNTPGFATQWASIESSVQIALDKTKAMLKGE